MRKKNNKEEKEQKGENIKEAKKKERKIKERRSCMQGCSLSYKVGFSSVQT